MFGAATVEELSKQHHLSESYFLKYSVDEHPSSTVDVGGVTVVEAISSDRVTGRNTGSKSYHKLYDLGVNHV